MAPDVVGGSFLNHGAVNRKLYKVAMSPAEMQMHAAFADMFDLATGGAGGGNFSLFEVGPHRASINRLLV